MDLMNKLQLIEEIIRLKKEKNTVILAHCYQNIEIDEVADFIWRFIIFKSEGC